MNRRQFLKTSSVTGGSLLLPTAVAAAEEPAQQIASANTPATAPTRSPIDPPASWIWYPSGRTLPSTFVLFRRTLHLDAKPRRATGWICGDSRYKLEVNGVRVQWGPAPTDPRWAEADPLDLTEHLTPGDNAIGVTVLYYGHGDGAAALGKPGLLFRLEIEHADGITETIVSDQSWQSLLCRAWSIGRPKRQYVRALQEEFDARLYPYGWSTAAFSPTPAWLPAMPLHGSPHKPALSTSYSEYMLDLDAGPADTELRPRSIPMMREFLVPIARLTQSYAFDWHSTPQDYFDFRIPNAWRARHIPLPAESPAGHWRLNMTAADATALTFEFTEQIVGWPSFTIDAPAGTIVELLVHEAHALDGPPLLNTHFDSWTRFLCREGRNTFETFDFESLRWLQLHVHNANGPVTISDVHVRRRVFPWANQPNLRTSEPALQRLFDASFNTLNNCAQETLVDGMARERQQYSGDCGHQIHALHLGFGEARNSARFLTTWSQGLTKDGFFLDCWPGYDRLARLFERQIDLTEWGPLLDHGVGFMFDCWHHYIYTANLDALREPYPRLIRFAQYLQSHVTADGLLAVENLGIPSVWIDHHAYQQQRHKQCAFNLYIAAAMENALAPICRAFGDPAQAEAVTSFGRGILKATIARFWSPQQQLFLNNLPWLSQEKQPRTDDRALATAILYDQCPGGQTSAALRTLADCPPDMGFSYPANAGWRLWALAKGGRADVIVHDLRNRWATLPSVLQNNTLQEDWIIKPDCNDEWSHCPVVPIYMTFQGLMGLKPLAPGFARYELRPQFADLNDLELTAFTLPGPMHLKLSGRPGDRSLTLQLPPNAQPELLLPEQEPIDLPRIGPATAGLRRYRLTPGTTHTLRLTHI